MSSRKKSKEKRHLEAVPTPIKTPEKNLDNIRNANFRLVTRKLHMVESRGLGLRHVTDFEPPDPAGPPNKHVLLDTEGVDFNMLVAIRARALKFMQALDEFEAVGRWVTDHPNDEVSEADCPSLHRTHVFTPDEEKAHQKPAELASVSDAPEEQPEA